MTEDVMDEEMEEEMELTGLEIAVVGLSVRFPGADGIDAFWKNLREGVESIRFFSDEELIAEGVWEQELQLPGYVKASGYLEGIDHFDAAFFGYSPVEALLMDPQLRLFHECAWEVFEDAACVPDIFNGSVGVYFGASDNLMWRAAVIQSGVSTGNSFADSLLSNKDLYSSRLSYRLNLGGPCVAVNSACSTSLVAIHLACRGLLGGECDMALAGGARIVMPRKTGYLYQEGMIESPDGHCRSFDREAAGTVFGLGIGVVLLKRLEDAIEAGNTIHAVIKGSAVNNDGSLKVGYTAPGVDGQAGVIAEALQVAEVEADSISYIEAHGTATALGDPIEIKAMSRAMKREKVNRCPIGTVKSNIGHLDCAAGVAGFIKTVLALKNRMIPPSLHFNEPNPELKLEETPFYVNNRLIPWERNGNLPLRAGVSAFGIGGTNAHVILEEWRQPSSETAADMEPGEKSGETKPQLLILSAKTDDALQQMAFNLGRYLGTHNDIPLKDVAYTLQVGRKGFGKRAFMVCRNNREAVEALAKPDMPDLKRLSVTEELRHTVFMFAGQGSQYVNMGRDLYEGEPVFREEADRCFIILKNLTGTDFKSILYPLFPLSQLYPPDEKKGINEIHRTEMTQPILFVFEYALAKLLIHLGIRPDAMMGYSFGEYTAACLAGVFSIEDALALVVLRGRLMGELPLGAMLSVPMPESELRPLLGEGLSIAIVNEPACIVAGPPEAIGQLEEQMKQRRLMCMRINISFAAHSSLMDEAAGIFEQKLKQVRFSAPTIPYISGITGNWITTEEARDYRYWLTHLRETIRFSAGVQRLLSEKQSIFLEIGPGRDLTVLVNRYITETKTSPPSTGIQGGPPLGAPRAGALGEPPEASKKQYAYNLVQLESKKESDIGYLMRRLGRLWLLRQTIDWLALHSDGMMRLVSLPTYPFQRKQYWWTSENIGFNQGDAASGGSPLARQPLEHWFYVPTWKRSEPVFQQPIFPSQCLIICGEVDLGNRLADALEREGVETVLVTMGNRFESIGRNRYIIDQNRAADYERLLQELAGKGRLPQWIFHMADIPGESHGNYFSDEAVSRVERTQDRIFYSLMFLVQAMGNLGFGMDAGEKIKLLVISNQMQGVLDEEELCPSQALLLGPVHAIPQEYPGIDCTAVDVAIRRGDNPEAWVIRQLIAEMALCGRDRVTALRNNRRWVQAYEPSPLPEPVGEGEPELLKENGVYLVIGGLGGIGLELARYIAGQVKARLVLTARKELAERDEATRNRVKEIETMGSEVMIMVADAADRQQMEKVFIQTGQRFGAFDGVIHAAGGVDYGGVIQGRQGKTDEADAFFAPKVRGALVLASLLKVHAPGPAFVVFCSSLASVLPPFGEVAYIAVNAFLDAFVRAMNLQWASDIVQNRRPVFRSINWGAWKEVGMAPAAVRKRGGDPDTLLRDEISPTEGSEAFRRILEAGYVQTAVSPRDLDVMARQMDFAASSVRDEQQQDTLDMSVLQGELHPRPDLDTPYSPPETETEHQMTGIWGQFFGLEQVGVDDDFFELGGDSLKAMAVASMVHKYMNAGVTLADFFNYSTVRELAGHIEAQGIQGYSAIEPVEEKEYYPVSAAQKRLFLLHQLEGGGIGYNETSVVDLGGLPDMEPLERAFRRIIERHESFRTSFLLIDDEPVQRIHPMGDIDFNIEIHQVESESDILEKETIGQFIQPFDLSRAPLLRAHLLRHGDEKSLLIVDMHHIIADGRSQELFTEEILALYAGVKLEPLTVRYRDFASRQNSDDVRGVIKRQESYWTDLYSGEIPRLNLPMDFRRPDLQSMAGASVRFSMSQEETAGIKALAAKHDVTLFMVLFSLYNVLLSRLSGGDDMVVGTPISGRGHADVQPLIGMFVNTLALRNRVKGEDAFSEFLRQLKKRSLEAFEHQDYPFEELVERVSTGRDTGRNPIFDVVFTLEIIGPAAGDDEGTGAGVPVPLEFDNPISRFDLVLTAYDMETELSFSLQYATTLFKHETALRFCNYFKRIATSVLADPGQRIADIEIMDEQEKQRVLVEFNGTERLFPSECTIPQLFSEHVIKNPDGIATMGPGLGSEPGDWVTVTYRTLDITSGILAGMLRSKGSGPDSIVILMMERSVEMITAIMGILKAGGGYLPIDPGFPADRIQFMAKDSGSSVMVTTHKSSEKVSFDGAISDDSSIIIIYIEDLLHTSTESPVEPLVTANAFDLAYVIYTSGTTGRPKGVMISHRNVARLVRDTDYIDIEPGDRVLQVLNVAFDGSVFNTFGALLNGATLVIPDEETLASTGELATLIKREWITMFVITTALFNALVDLEIEAFSGMRKILVGGEKLSPPHMRKALVFLGPGRLINGFGPTESTVFSNCYAIDHVAEDAQSIPIGPPIANTTVYIVDKYLNPVPVMVQGEIIIGGAGVARGYLNRPQLTAQKFIGHPDKCNLFSRTAMDDSQSHSSDPSNLSHLFYYRTGDLGYWMPDGNVEFTGRMDQQVKIRGFRIELEEIEWVLLKHETVRDVSVMVRNNHRGEPYLCAYIVYNEYNETGSIESSGTDSEVLKRFLEGLLPNYMIPSSFVILDKLPLTATGKVDKRALPEPVVSVQPTGGAPKNEIEAELIDIWANILKIDTKQVGPDSHFFELGGHSLTAMIMIARLDKRLRISMPLAEVFKNPTVRSLAEVINGMDKKRFTALTPGEWSSYYPLSSAQERLYILQQLEKGGTAYNMPCFLPVPQGADVEPLVSVFRQLIKRHEILRTAFILVDEAPMQRIYDNVELNIETVDLTGESVDLSIDTGALTARLVSPFDLSEAPLIRVKLVKLKEGEDETKVLFIDMHHIITDGTSQTILEREFTALMSGETLPGLKLQYKDYAQWLKEPAQVETLQKQKKYWLEVFSDELPVLILPYDFPRPDMQRFDGATVAFVLSETETRLLRETADEAGATLYMVLLSVYSLLLSKLSGQEDIIVGTPTAARRHADLESIIGMFVNTLPMRTFPKGSSHFTSYLKEVKTSTLDAFENQEYPFEELVEALSVRRDTGRNPIFDVMFNLLNQSEYNGVTSVNSDQGAGTGSGYRHRTGTAKFDLNLTAVDYGNQLFLDLEYCTALFKPEFIERFIGYFKRILSNLSSTDHRMQPLSGIDILTETEREMVLEMSNGGPGEWELGGTIHELFEEQTARTPDNVALTAGIINSAKHDFDGWTRFIASVTGMAGTNSLTYRHVNETANRLAHHLRNRGITRNSVVGLMAERSFEMIIGILAILKAGGAYLPIDAEYPVERMTYMLKDSRVPLLLTNLERIHLNRDTIELPGVEVLDLTDTVNYKSGENNYCNPEPVNTATDVLYVLYTSGSTGLPKGVVLEHGNLVNLMKYQYSCTSIDFSKVLQFTTIGFDVSFQEIFSTLLAGGELVLIESETRNDMIELFGLVGEHKIKTLFLPAAYLKMVISEVGHGHGDLIPGCVDHIVTAGEQLVLSSRFKELLRNQEITLHNHYGPTETHVVTTFTMAPPDTKSQLPPIGRPLPNVSITIVDNGGHLVPSGVPGELNISGVQVGRGYLNNPELTEQMFFCTVDSQFDPSDSSHMSHRSYRTGDLARWLPDGNLKFLGRMDKQVKIRGFRVELGEIENRLLDIKGIDDAVVVDRQEDSGQKYLCAYIVLEPGTALPIYKEADVKRFLSETLPDYMVPAAVMTLERIPLTPNGKTDIRALPVPEIQAGEGYLGPRNWLEETLVTIWADILTIPAAKIGIDDNFFDLGGHSLKATILTARIHKILDAKMQLGEIFKNPTIRSIAEYLKAKASIDYHSIPAIEKKEYYPLSSAQKRMFLLNQMKGEDTSDNITTVITLETDLDDAHFESVLEILIHRHEVLRTSFFLLDDEPVQRVFPEIPFTVERYTVDASTGNTESVIANFVRPFDLSRVPLFRVGLVEITGEETRRLLMYDLHHIISDGTSNGIFASDFLMLYSKRRLPDLRIQYKDFAQWQNDLIESGAMNKQESYWLNRFSKDKPLPVLNLPLDYPRPEIQSYEGKTIRFRLPGESVVKVKELILDRGVTLYIFLLAVYTVLLSKYAGQEDILVGSPIAGRPHADLERIVGIFVNTLVMRNFPCDNKCFVDFMNEVKQNALEAYENQDYQFEILVDRLGIQRDRSRSLLFDTMFVVQNTGGTAAPSTETEPEPIQPQREPANGFDSQAYDFDENISQFDIIIHAYEDEEGIAFLMNYCAKLFKPETMERFKSHFMEIVETVTESMDVRLKDIKLSHQVEEVEGDIPDIDFSF